MLLGEIEGRKPPHPRSLAACGLWAGFRAGSWGGASARRGWRGRRAGRGWRLGAEGARRPFSASVPRRFPALYNPSALAACKPWHEPHSPPPEQPARRPVCLIRSSLTSSAKLSLVNPISSNHSVWHVLQFCCCCFRKRTRSLTVWKNNVGVRCLSPEP